VDTPTSDRLNHHVTIPRAVNPAWTLRYVATEGLLIAEAGADETYGFVDVASDVGDAIVVAWCSSKLDDLTGDAAQAIVQRLRLLGAVTSGAVTPDRTLKIATVCVGERSAAIARVLEGHMTSAGSVQLASTTTLDDADLTVVLRTGGSYEELAGRTETLARASGAHLLVDASFHHTLCIGPIVTGDGSTACLGCLNTRLRGRWGESFAPPAPAASDHAEFVAALAANEVRNWAAGTSSLVGRVVRLDMRTWQTTFDVVLRAPGCERCRTHRTRLR
jgi:hypothetical protein